MRSSLLRRGSFAIAALLTSLACADSVPSSSGEGGGGSSGGAGGAASGGAGGVANGGAGGVASGGSGGSGGALEAGVRLTVDDARWGPARVGGVQPQPERVFLEVTATLAIAPGEPAASVAFVLFSLETAGGPLVAASSLTPRLAGACAADFSVAPGGRLTCPLLFEAPAGFTPAAILYQVPGGATARGPLPALPPCTPCDRACVDLTSDPDNCGACGEPLVFGESCVLGVPTCEDASLSRCVDRSGRAGCVDLQTDRAHCGRCNRALSIDSGQICVRGQPSCPAGTSSCALQCVDLSTDETNCGGCGLSCDAEFSCRDGAACRIERDLLIAQRGMTCDAFCAGYPGGTCISAEIFHWSNGSRTPLRCDELSTGRQDEQDVSCVCETPPG